MVNPREGSNLMKLRCSRTKVILSASLVGLMFFGEAFCEIKADEQTDMRSASGNEIFSVSPDFLPTRDRRSHLVDLPHDLKGVPDRIDALVAPYLNSSSFSGEIFVAQKGKVLFDKGYGLSNYEFDVPVTPQTKFYIASITKSFTAAAVLLLQDKGMLSINDAVSRFIPDFTDGAQITIHHLLTHTSGIADFLRFPNFFELSKSWYTTEEAVNLFRHRPLLFKPGEQTNYSNSNYVLLAYIIEKVSGKTYADFLKGNFLIPLGMTNTGEPTHANQLINRLASGYGIVGFNEFETGRYFDRSIVIGAASLYSNAGDLL